MSSYITADDLEALELAPTSSWEPFAAPNRLENRDGPHSGCSFSSTRSSGDLKHVAFSSMAVLIQVADEGEVEPAMASAYNQALGRKQLGVRTYSLETPNFKNAFGRVRNGLSATLEPLLNSAISPGAGVASTSRVRESSPDRERSQYRCPTRARRGSVSSWSSIDEDNKDALDSTLAASSPARLRLKIPTVTRRCNRPALATQTSKSILRTTSGSSPTPSPTITTSSSSPQSLAISPTSISSPPITTASPRKPLPTVSTSPLDRPPLPFAHPQAAVLVPVVDCCRTCVRATEYGHGVDGVDEYIERWSRGAKKLKAEQEREAAQKEEWERNTAKISTSQQALDRSSELGKKEDRETVEPATEQNVAAEDADDEEEAVNLTASRLGLKAKGVDELQLDETKRHVKTIVEKEHAAVEHPVPIRSPSFEEDEEPVSPQAANNLEESRRIPPEPLPKPSPSVVSSFESKPAIVPDQVKPNPTRVSRSSSFSNRIKLVTSKSFGSTNWFSGPSSVNSASYQSARFS
ncbi:uncharacterized protein JCM15063_001633 [Sporobolomyces koalae]|uniref:uncharacterized protein n=1 Tax=Sporobolomyces koalae TaxID=500713 RepID=UPI003173AEDB